METQQAIPEEKADKPISASIVGAEYSWKWFEFFAAERHEHIRMFFIVVAGLSILVSFVASASYSRFGFAILGTLYCVSALTFILLDVRSRTMLGIGEKSFVAHCRAHGIKDTENAMHLAMTRKRGLLQYQHLFWVLYGSMIFFGVFLVTLSLNT